MKKLLTMALLVQLLLLFVVEGLAGSYDSPDDSTEAVRTNGGRYATENEYGHPHVSAACAAAGRADQGTLKLHLQTAAALGCAVSQLLLQQTKMRPVQ
jgi:hypothetical protein